MTRPLLLSALLLPTALAACVSVQDFEGETKAADEKTETPSAPSLGPSEPKPVVGVPRWHWRNPAPTGRTLLGVGGTSDRDVWVAGEGGNVAHFDGTRWDKRIDGTFSPDPSEPSRGEGARYFAVGTVAKDDVWIAGELSGKTEVLHYDGKTWVKSYPFAGSGFTGFSHGPGKRLFAVVDWTLLELEAGKWKPTDTSQNRVFGKPQGVWVSATGEAWTITAGTKIMKLPAGSATWQLQPPIPGIPPNAAGLAISGSGTEVCAFFTGRAAATGGAGFLHHDGAWHVSPLSTDPLPLGATPYGTRAACLADGTGVMAYDGQMITATETAAPGGQPLSHYRGERLFGAFSPDGQKAFTVGTLGALLARNSGSAEWKEQGPTRRRDLVSLDVGLDGTLFVADAAQPVRTFGGDVLVDKADAFARVGGAGISGPSIPVGVAAIAADDVWVLANDRSGVGIAHFTGTWGRTSFLAASTGADKEPLAIWAPAKDDLWVTARDTVWHYADGKFTVVASGATYRAIHGSGPSDVWFAGEGVAHWNGKTFERRAEPKGAFTGVWASAPGRVWLWGERALLFDGNTSVPVETALHASTEWVVDAIAEASTGDLFVLTKTASGTSLLWFDPSRTKLLDVVDSDLELSGIRGRGDKLFAFGAGGACLEFGPSKLR